VRHASTRRLHRGTGTHLRCDARSSPLAKHATDGQEHDVVAYGLGDGEELVIIGPRVAEGHELVRAAVRTPPPVAVEDQSLPFNQELSNQHAQLLGLEADCEAPETQLVDRSQQEAVVAILTRRLEAAAALRVEAVVQGAKGLEHVDQHRAATNVPRSGRADLAPWPTRRDSYKKAPRSDPNQLKLWAL
jgi:hypothetical protein